MSLITILLTAGAYMLAIVSVWIAIVRMRTMKSIAAGLLPWICGAAFAALASYLLGNSLARAFDFFAHVNVIVLLGYFVVEYLVYQNMQGGRTQIYWLVVNAASFAAVMLIGSYFLPVQYGLPFSIMVLIPVSIGLSPILIYIFPTLKSLHLKIIAISWCVIWGSHLVIHVLSLLSYEMFGQVDTLLNIGVSVSTFFFAVMYLNALSTRNYLPAHYYFNVGKVYQVTFVSIIVSVILYVFLVTFGVI